MALYGVCARVLEVNLVVAGSTMGNIEHGRFVDLSRYCYPQVYEDGREVQQYKMHSSLLMIFIAIQWTREPCDAGRVVISRCGGPCPQH